MSTEGHVPDLRLLGIGEVLDVAIAIAMRHWRTSALLAPLSRRDVAAGAFEPVGLDPHHLKAARA